MMTTPDHIERLVTEAREKAEAVERQRILNGIGEIRARIEGGNNDFQYDRVLATIMRIESGIRSGNFV